MKVSAQTIGWLALLFLQVTAQACLWDSDSLADEKKSHPTLAAAILGNPPDLGDPTKLRQRIADLQSNRHESDPAWWNDLAGAYIRLGEAQRAVELLETVITRFPDDYGIHANLGTAYHLLGRYADAEREIARDLAINPDAHFGLEKYHLALLQYLMRDEQYQQRHVYIDEFSIAFIRYRAPILSYPQFAGAFSSNSNESQALRIELEQEYAALVNTNSPDSAYASQRVLTELVALDPLPSYRERWDLAANTNLLSGVIYMAELNPRQPACFVMLGVLAAKQRDLNLARAAFEKAIVLGSPQGPLLESKVASIREHIGKARSHRNGIWFVLGIACVATMLAILALRAIVRFFKKKSRPQ